MGMSNAELRAWKISWAKESADIVARNNAAAERRARLATLWDLREQAYWAWHDSDPELMVAKARWQHQLDLDRAVKGPARLAPDMARSRAERDIKIEAARLLCPVRAQELREAYETADAAYRAAVNA